jgi:tubulin-specific chaperone A
MADPRTRQIKIQTGVVKRYEYSKIDQEFLMNFKYSIIIRIIKEKSMYEKEVKLTENRIQKMKDDGKDEYDIKKMGEVLQESEMMVPETAKRLLTAYEDLKNKLNVNLKH